MSSSIFCQLYGLDVTTHLGKEYVPFIEDVSRILIIQIIFQIMLLFKNPMNFGLFDGDFIESLFYLAIGVCVYWLIFKRLVVVK